MRHPGKYHKYFVANIGLKTFIYVNHERPESIANQSQQIKLCCAVSCSSREMAGRRVRSKQGAGDFKQVCEEFFF